ncbi:hypothetical protein [uncultured Campylobacter sp.]|uniref:hypothetical protein n=1 Tax=uncultured Campylobacter sp. TaxID=218934 RepID=UPI00260349F2|nr:hypothetical protein [uncultured Campylobacter sp.]
MIILGHALVPYEPLYLIKNGDEVFKYDNLLFKFNDRLIAAAPIMGESLMPNAG